MATSDFTVGTRVRLTSTGECGVVVAAWGSGVDRECYVAFYGDSFPPIDAPPAAPPYVLRYFAVSLTPSE